MLVSAGTLTREVVELLAANATVPLGTYISAHGAANRRTVKRAIAAQLGLGFVDFSDMPPDASLFSPRDVAHYQTQQFIPFARVNGTLQLATPAPTNTLREWAKRHYGEKVELLVTGTRDLNTYFANRAATATTRNAQLGLRRRNRHLSACRVLLRSQAMGLSILLASIAAFCVAFPHTGWQALLIGCNLFYLVTLAVKIQLYLQGRAAQPTLRKLSGQLTADVAAMDDATLPTYSILVPLYKESFAVMARLLSHLVALDYPPELLDIKLIVEADDADTIDALKRLKPPQRMEIIHVPPSLPRTKPKACNVALPQLRGEFSVIYDAEDAPAPDQLKRAVALFRRCDARVACVQASLNYYNREENILTQWFSIEYSALFGLLLPALERIGVPIPLGGTSNHLRTEALKRVGGWDAFNVTEDADLGVRLSYLGYRTRILPSLTLEESPIDLRTWLCQRTRWVKGYIQTWLVYTRDVAGMKSRLGMQAYYGFQFFVGAPAITFLLAPVFWALFIVSLTGLLPMNLSPFMLTLCMTTFLGGFISHWLFAREVLGREGWPKLRLAMLTYPFYWLLHAIAAARALWQLATTPHLWEKTTHGVSKLFR